MTDFIQDALPLFASGEFKPEADAALPLQQQVKAHQMINERAHYGKVITQVP